MHTALLPLHQSGVHRIAPGGLKSIAEGWMEMATEFFISTRKRKINPKNKNCSLTIPGHRAIHSQMTLKSDEFPILDPRNF
jgi:hypothetical protein